MLKLARDKEATEAAKGPSLAKIPEGAEGGEDDTSEMDEVAPENGVEANGKTITCILGKVQNKSNGKGKGRQKGNASTSNQSSLKEKLQQITFSHDFKTQLPGTVTTVGAQPQRNHSSGAMNVSGFVSDLSKFSTIGINYLEKAVNRETLGDNKLGTITEESMEGSDGVTKAKETSLLPTFVEDI